MAEQITSKPRRKGRKILLLLGGFVLIVLVFLALIPSFVSWGWLHGTIVRSINNSINGTAQFSRIKASWFGSQNLENLTITQPDGTVAANLNLVIHNGLWQLITQRPGPLKMTISGTLTGEVRPDNSLSFGDLLKKSPAASQPAPPAQPSSSSLASIPPITVDITGLTLNLSNSAINQKLTLDNMTGQLVYDDPSQPLTVNLQCKTLTNGTPGSFSIKGESTGLLSPLGTLSLNGATAKLNADAQSVQLPFSLPPNHSAVLVNSFKLDLVSVDLTGRIVMSIDANGQVQGQPPSTLETQIAVNHVLSPAGALALKGGSANITINAQNVPIASGDLHGVVSQFKSTLVSDDLTGVITIAMDSNAQVESHSPSAFTADLRGEQLLTETGQVQFAPERITGTVQGSTVPTSVLDPFFARTPIVPSRDFGSVADISATMAAGLDHEMTVMASSPLPLRFEMNARINPTTRQIEGSHLLFDAPLQPELVKNLANITIDRPAATVARLTSFLVPPMEPNQPYPLGQAAAAGIISVRGPLTVALPDQAKAAGENGSTQPATTAPAAQPKSFAVHDLVVQLDSPALAEQVNIDGSAVIDNASVTIKETVTHLFDGQSKLALLNATPVGTLSVSNVSPATVQKFTSVRPELISEAIGSGVSATVTTSSADAGLAANIQAEMAALKLNVNAVRQSQSLAIGGAHFDLNLTPKLVALAQQGNPVSLQSPATITIDVQPFDMPEKSMFSYALPAEPIRATVESPRLALGNVPGVAEPVALVNLVTDLGIGISATPLNIKADGDFELRRPKANQHVSGLRFRFDYTNSAAMSATAQLGFGELSVVQLEQLLGKPRGTYSDLTGENGAMNARIQVSGDTFVAHLQPSFPLIKGEFDAMKNAELVSISGDTSELLLGHQLLEKRMNGEKAAGTGTTDETLTRVPDDVPLKLSIKSLKLPTAMFNGQAFDPSQAEINVTASGGPLNIINPGDVRTKLSDVVFSLDSKSLSDGVNFAVNANADATIPQPQGEAGTAQARATATQLPNTISTPKPGALNVTGKLIDLVSQDSKLNPITQAKLQLNADVKEVPTAVADALAKMEGLLVAAVGPIMNATIKADRFSSDSGQLNADLQTSNGSLKAVVHGREDAFNVNKNNPITGNLTLTPALRDRLLYKVHPVLADIRSTEHPVEVNIPWVQAPLKPDGGLDLSKLGANIEINIGKVAFDSGSTTLFLLKAVGQADKKQTIAGEIEPIVANIRKGILTYQRFAMHIDRWTMVYSGQINLVQGTVDLRTELPLAALGQSVKELEPYADKITVPIVTRGKFGEVKTSIDPDFDFGKAAVNAGFSGGIEQLLHGKGLGDLFKKLK